MDLPERTEIFRNNPDGARGLRDQAAACRRLAAEALTKAGMTSMNALADHFDEQARKIELAESTVNTDAPTSTQKIAK